MEGESRGGRRTKRRSRVTLREHTIKLHRFSLRGNSGSRLYIYSSYLKFVIPGGRGEGGRAGRCIDVPPGASARFPAATFSRRSPDRRSSSLRKGLVAFIGALIALIAVLFIIVDAWTTLNFHYLPGTRIRFVIYVLLAWIRRVRDPRNARNRRCSRTGSTCGFFSEFNTVCLI